MGIMMRRFKGSRKGVEEKTGNLSVAGVMRGEIGGAGVVLFLAKRLVILLPI